MTGKALSLFLTTLEYLLPKHWLLVQGGCQLQYSNSYLYLLIIGNFPEVPAGFGLKISKVKLTRVTAVSVAGANMSP